MKHGKYAFLFYFLFSFNNIKIVYKKWKINIAINAQNAKLLKDVKRIRKQHFIFEKMFKYDDIEQRKKKEIDVYFYNNNIFLSLLYLFYKKIQRKHFEKQI